MISKNEILKFLQQHKQQMQDKFQVNSLALFGSFANGNAKQDSDIDILVDMPSSFDNYFNLKYFLEDNLNTKVDLAKEKTIRLLVKEQIKDELIYV